MCVLRCVGEVFGMCGWDDVDVMDDVRGVFEDVCDDGGGDGVS